MSSRLETLQVAKLSPKLLGESAELVAELLLRRQSSDGGFRGREGEAGDLYYTIFGLDALNALDQAPPEGSVQPFLQPFGDGEGLDLIYLSCLIRSWVALGALAEGPRSSSSGLTPDLATLRQRLDGFRQADGGWSTEPGGERGSTYGTFLAISAYQDLGAPIPQPDEVARFLLACRTDEGGFAPDMQFMVPTTPTTAAGVAALRQVDAAPPPETADWLRARRHPQGGFLPAIDAPMPDLLSTAVALHALSSLGASLEDLADPMLDYVDTLWNARGGFHGHWADDELDCEYTFYGLLALGHLSVWTR